MESLAQNHSSRLDFRTDVIALDSLCSSIAIARLTSAVQSLNQRDCSNFLRGYRLAVATSLYDLLEFTIDHADLLGLEFDDRLGNWLHFRRQEHTASILSAVSDLESDLGRLCSMFDSLLAALRRADDGLDETVAALKRCGHLASLLGRLAEGCAIVSLSTGEEVADRDAVLRTRVAERVLDYLEYRRSYHLAYELVWSGQSGSVQDDDFVLRAETHLDSISSLPVGRDIPSRWWNGLCFGFDSVVRANGVSLPSHCQNDLNGLCIPDWYRELQAFVNSAYTDTEWPSLTFGLSEFSQSAVSKLSDCLEVDVPHVPSKDRLVAILGSDTVRLITSMDATDYMDLEVLLAGAIAAYEESPIQVLVMDHSDDPDQRTWVSVGVRLPRYGQVSNFSRWYVFHKMYHEGRIIDSDVAVARKKVMDLISRFQDKLNIEELHDLDGRDLLRLCELRAFRQMRNLSQKAVDANAELRGGISELLAAYWLQSQGYSNIRVSFKRASLGEYEYDVIGVKDGQCMAVEVKGGDVQSDRLKCEIDWFSGKVENLRSKLVELKRALGCEDSIHSVSGLFISLADLSKFEIGTPSVRLWDYGSFTSRLKAAGLPNRIVGLLERSRIIHSFQIDDFPEDEFFVGLND